MKALWVTVLLLGGAGLWWIHQPLPISGEAVDLSIEPGTPPRAVAQAVADAGVPVSPLALYAWFRLSGQARQIRAGNYALEPGTTPRSLLRKLVRGEESLRTLTIVEGWNWRQVRAALAQASDLRADSRALDDATLMQALGRPGVAPEGRFFPDTYTYAKGASDLSILARAMRAMDHQLAAAWALRASDLPLASAEEALILASIIEKETAREQDRRLIAGVFINRLRRGMPLQTDPTVIYGLGERFDGNLRKRDLQTDTPWNTYTRSGLPPTPIAMPGRASLLAAVQPATTDAIYFVARGDGSSHFSATLEEHNRAVNRYQRGQ
ncbi:endolytic transglycosylase MltG [Tibeticola sediminis]|uniref:endolytic transglycosylase MltG n=1 Tax=Tibeticola sediminis TaxID=1917811 RepID=UPI00319D9332